ncbi:MAG: hypothetical protein RI907_3777 [Pseudomonadota bacterium]|jgi:PAS domain S-box-containing protein
MSAHDPHHLRAPQFRPTTASQASPEDAQALLEDLRIHQVELELQAQALTLSEATAKDQTRRLQHLLGEVPVALLRLDHRGRVLFLNRAAEQLLGQSATQAEGHFLYRMAANEAERLRLLQAISTGLVCDRHVSAGHHCLVAGNAMAVLDVHMSRVPGQDSPDRSEWLVSLVDQTAMVRRQQQQEATLAELREALGRNRELASVANAMPDLVAVCDPDEQALWVNPGFEVTCGWGMAALHGHSVLARLIQPEGEPDAAETLRLLRVQWALSDTVKRRRVRVQRARGEPFLADLTLLAVRDGEGQVVRRIVMAQDVSEAARLEAERELAMRQQALHTVQSEFLSRMSHNMRTPLNAIMGFSQLLHLSLGPGLSDEDRQRLRIIHEAGEQLLHMVDQSLSLVQGDQLARRVEFHPVQLAPLVADAIMLLNDKAAAKHIQLIPQVRADAWVTAHEQLTHEVVVNLLSNAIKYSHPGQAVSVGLRACGPAELALEVVDQGIGISEADLPNLFKPFQRLGEGRHMASGHGLGLAISAQQVRWMDGRLEVRSQPGQGSTFSLILPLSLPGDHATAPLSQDEEVRQRLLSLPAMSLLYVEDNRVNQAVMSAALALCPQVKLFTADNLAQGHSLCEVIQPDVLVLDVNLPDGNGLDLCRSWRATPVGAQCTCLALSADVMPEQVSQAMAAGVDQFLAKPLDLGELSDALARHAMHHRLPTATGA